MAEPNQRLNSHPSLPGKPPVGSPAGSPMTPGPSVPGVDVAKRTCSEPGCVLPEGHAGEHACGHTDALRSDDHRQPSSRTRVPRLELSEAPAGRCVVIRCDGKAYAYRCAPGQERELLDRALQDARNEEHPLTYFDAALIAHRLGRQLADDLDHLNPSDTQFRRGA